jgi:hypothetical protein
MEDGCEFFCSDIRTTFMDRETLLQAIEHGPVRVTMNDGLYG